MELISGITLKQYMDKKGALDWKEVVHFAKQITRALSHAHERGIIHRDIKPQNILVDETGIVKVADFPSFAMEAVTPVISPMTSSIFAVVSVRVYVSPSL